MMGFFWTETEVEAKAIIVAIYIWKLIIWLNLFSSSCIHLIIYLLHHDQALECNSKYALDDLQKKRKYL